MQAIALIKTFISFVGAKVAVALNVAAGAQATMAIGSAVIAGTALVAKKAMSLFEVDMAMPDTDRSRQSTVKSATAPQKFIYGKALVSGPVSFIGLGGSDNEDLYQTIVLAGHECASIDDVYFDDLVITKQQINSGNQHGGAVNGGAFNAENGVNIVTINKYLGAASQTADSMFTTQFGNYTSDHRGDGIAYLAMKWVLNADSAKTWDKFAPQNVSALVRGRLIYDPRLEVAAGGTAGATPSSSNYIAYSDNPALCAIDYLMDQTIGLKVPATKIAWDQVITAANGCDVTVTIPNGTEKTFACNGVVFATDSHQKNLNKILSSMNGTLVYSNGKYVIRAGIYTAPTVSLNEDSLVGSISVKTSIDRSERVNTIKGLFIDPAQGHKMVEFPTVQLSTELQRDNNQVMEKETQLTMTNTSFMAQRLAHKIIKAAGQQKVITFPANYSALNITAGDRVQVSIEELSWVDKIFICVSWVFSEDGGIALTLREDSPDAYSNPTSYSQISGTGTITDASRGVPSPSGLQVESAESKIFLNWVNPSKPSDFNTIEVWVSATNVRSNAVKLGETNGTQFTHDQSNAAITYAVGDTLYYWIRAKKNVGAATDTTAVSGYFPATTTSSANVTVTAAAVDWTNVANPTIGIDINNDTISINTGVANTTTGQTVAKSGIEAGTTVTQGGITMNQGGSIKGGQSAYNSGTGFFLGYDTNKYKFSIGNAGTEALTFDGTNLAVTGAITANSLTVDEANITGTLTLGGGVLQDGSGNNLTTTTTLNVNQVMSEVTGVVSQAQHAIPSFYRIETDTAVAPTNAQFNTEAARLPKVDDIAITTDTTVTPNRTYGWTCTAAGTASTEATWGQITDFISGDLLVDGTITADNIATNAITAIKIDSNVIGTDKLTVGVSTSLGRADTASQVNAGLALLLNKDTFGNANSGEASLVSIDKDGVPILETSSTTSNGFIQWNGSKITVEAVQYTSTATVKFTVLTDLAGKRGFIVFDTTKSNPFTVASVAMDVAFAYKEGNQWYYDNNASAVTFTPTNDMVALGYLETSAADTILKGGLINPVTLTAAAFPSDELKSGSIGGINIDGSKIYAGTGTWGNTNTGFYLDNTGKFSLKDSLTFDPSTGSLQVVGSVETDVLTVNEQFNLFGNTFFAHGVKDGAITADMLAGSAINLLQGSLAQSVGGSNGDFKEGTGTFTTTGGSIVLGASGDLFDHGELGIDLEANFSISWNSTTNYGVQNFTLQFQVSTDGTNYTNVGTSHSVTISTYDLSSYYPGNYYVHYSYTDITETISAGSLTNNADYYIRALISSVPTSVTGQTPSFTFSANEGVTGVTSTGGNADTLDNLDSTAFLRSNVNDTLDADLVITGDLTVQGTTTTINVADLTVADKDITLNYSTGDSSATANNAGIIIQDAVSATNDASILWKTASDTFEFSHAISTKNATFDNGTNTTVDVIADDDGMAQIRLYGAAQGTGRLYVGQSTDYGGGIEYNGDNSPSTTGAGADYIALFRNTVGTLAWTARNYYDSNDWEFRGNITANSNLYLRSSGGEAGIYLQDSSASNATAFKIYADVSLATSTLYIDYDTSVAGNNWAFVNNGNFLASGTIYADGAASNSLQWETGYDYSQIGHLPLAGGTLTGGLTGVTAEFFSAIGTADDIRSGLAHYDTTAMAAGVGGQLVLGYKYLSTGGYTVGAILKTYKENATSNHYGSGLKFQVRNTGAALSTKMTLDPSGNLTAVGSLTSDGILSNDIVRSKRDIRSAGQIRATGWRDDAASTDYDGLAFEIGVSSSSAFALSFNRNDNTYGPMQFNADNFTFNNVITNTSRFLSTKVQHSSATSTNAHFIALPSGTSDTTGLSSMFLATSTVDGYGVSVSGARKTTNGTPTFSIRTHNNSTTGVEVLTISNAGSLATNGTIRANSTGVNVHASVSATWSSGVGMFMDYHPNLATGYIDNTYDRHVTQTYGDIEIRQKVSGTMTTRLLFDNSDQSAKFNVPIRMESGNVIYAYTSTGNLRGYIRAVESDASTNAGLVIATSGGEAITFKDNGLSGTRNVEITGTGHLNLFQSLLANGTEVLDTSRNLVNIGTITSGGINSSTYVGAADDIRLGITSFDTAPMAANVGGQILLGYKYTSSGTYTQGAIIRTYKENAGNGEYGSGLKFQVRNHGASLSTKMSLSPGGQLYAGYYGRTAHHTGYLQGGYNNVGSSGGKSSPIYSIGSAYYTTDTTLGNLYGVGFTTYNATLMGTAIPGGTDWGFYVANAGVGRVWLDGSNGNIGGVGGVYATGGFYVGTTQVIDSARNIATPKVSLTNPLYGIGVGTANGGRFDTVDSGINTDPLELVYYSGAGVVIGNGGTKYLRAGSYKIGNTEVITGGRNLTNVGTYNGYYPAQAAASSYTNSVICADTRSTNDTPSARSRGLYVDFKTQSVIGLTGSGTYAGVLTFRSYGSSTDLSGGPPIQIAYDNAGTLQTRVGSGASTWYGWKQIHLAGNSLGASSIYASDIVRTQRDIYSAGQIRATGWYTDAGSTDYTGLGFEIGVSGSSAFALSYNRNNNTYGPMTFNATVFSFNSTINCAAIIATSKIDSSTYIGAADDVRLGITSFDTAAMAAGVGGQLILGYKYTSAGTQTAGAILKAYKENAVNGQYGSGLKFQVRNHGASLSTKLTLDPSGNLTATGNVTAYSDERLKDNIKTLDGSKVLQMRGVSFTKDRKAGSGVIAQELEQIASELVHTSDDEMGTKSVAYGNLVGYLIENAKQQQSEIDELKALVKKLMEK